MAAPVAIIKPIDGIFLFCYGNFCPQVIQLFAEFMCDFHTTYIRSILSRKARNDYEIQTIILFTVSCCDDFRNAVRA